MEVSRPTQFPNVALSVSLLAIQVMIVKRSQDVSYWSKNNYTVLY